MKVLFAVPYSGLFWRHFTDVALGLVDRGHDVAVIRTTPGDRKISPEAKQELNSRLGAAFEAPQLQRGDWKWREISQVAGDLLNYASYLRPGHPSSGLAWRITQYLPALVRDVVRTRAGKWAVARRATQGALRGIVWLVPPGKGVSRWMADNRPDILVVSPYIYPGRRYSQVDYVKAAARLGVPSVVPVASWDNLTTKGTFLVMPDLVLVWNRSLAEEAVEFHRVPPGRIRITGAPTFDFSFEMRPSMDREAFCRQVGIDPARPFVLYLGSSRTIAGDETEPARQFVNSVAQHPKTRDIGVLIRPHPFNTDSWEGFSAENAVVWLDGALPDTAELKRGYYDSLFHTLAAVGINTSAFFEAAIVDTPCVAVLTDRYRAVQTELGHFRQLLKGHFMEVADSFEHSAEVLAMLRRGVDSKAADRRRFVNDFIRPWGMNRSSSEIMAEVIEATALGTSTEPWSLSELERDPAIGVT